MESTPARTGLSIGWLLKQLLSIGLLHVAVLARVYFLLPVGDAGFTSDAIVLRAIEHRTERRMEKGGPLPAAARREVGLLLGLSRTRRGARARPTCSPALTVECGRSTRNVAA